MEGLLDGLFFADRMRRLNDAEIKVFAVFGNHDAENRFRQNDLGCLGMLHLFSSRKVESIAIDDIP